MNKMRISIVYALLIYQATKFKRQRAMKRWNGFRLHMLFNVNPSTKIEWPYGRICYNFFYVRKITMHNHIFTMYSLYFFVIIIIYFFHCIPLVPLKLRLFSLFNNDDYDKDADYRKVIIESHFALCRYESSKSARVEAFCAVVAVTMTLWLSGYATIWCTDKFSARSKIKPKQPENELIYLSVQTKRPQSKWDREYCIGWMGQLGSFLKWLNSNNASYRSVYRMMVTRLYFVSAFFVHKIRNKSQAKIVQSERTKG